MEDDYMGVSVRIAEIERHAKTSGAVTANEALWLIDELRQTMAGQQSLLMGIAKSAELLGDALDSLDVPERLLDDLELWR